MTKPRWPGAMLRFVLVGALAGLLTAGLAVPFAALAGLATEKASDAVKDLPRELKVVPPAQKSAILAADGSLIATLYEQNRVPVRLSQVHPIMRKAIVAIEDDRFFEHGALDAKGTLRALLRNQAGGTTQQGGSSITQQYVKLSLIEKAIAANDPRAYQAATANTYQRKIAELRYAVAVEQQLSKEEILERYLNLANFGDGAYGVEAAAGHYFGTTAAKLTLPQAALLAGLVKNPTGYDPTNNARRAKERRDTVLRRMLELKVISAAHATKAMRTPVIDRTRVRRVPNGCASSRYPFYCEFVVAGLLANRALGRTQKDREHFIRTAGLVVRTSLDPRAQAAAQAALDRRTKPSDEAAAAITLVEPGTGLVRAMAQSRPYGRGRHQTAYNYNVDKSYPGGYGGFQNGSTMKAFTIAAAIQQGIPLTHRIESPKMLDLRAAVWPTCDGSTKAGSDYTPKNSTAANGNLTMVEAAKASTNTYFLLLSKQVGLCAVANVASALGMRDAQRHQPLQQVISMTLGVGQVTPLMVANAYATFAARGRYCRPIVVTSITRKDGSLLPTPSPRCRQAIAPWVADGVNAVLKQVMEGGGTGAKLRFGSGDVAGKSGAINDNKAVWFAGYTTRLSGAAVVADATLPYEDLIGQTLDGRRVTDATGSGTAGPLWSDAMRRALKGVRPTRFVVPSDKVLRGDVKPIPSVAGMSPADAIALVERAGFVARVAPGTVDSAETAGAVAYTTPRRIEGALDGATVTLHLSNGGTTRSMPSGGMAGRSTTTR